MNFWGLFTWLNQDDRMNMIEISEYDQNWWTWPKNWQQRTLTLNMTETIISIITTTNINGWIWPKIIYFFQSNSSIYIILMFVGVIFWSSSIVKVHWCEDFSVTSPKFGHIDLVRWFSLKFFNNNFFLILLQYLSGIFYLNFF